MPIPQVPALPALETALSSLTVDELKWYAAYLPEKTPTRKGELIEILTRHLLDINQLRRFWAQIPIGATGQYMVAEVIHTLDGHYKSSVLRAKYPQAPIPQSAQNNLLGMVIIGSRSNRNYAGALDMLFYRSAEIGIFIPLDLLKLLQTFVPKPPKTRMRGQAEMPGFPSNIQITGTPPEILHINCETAIFHDLTATLHMIQQGKASVSATTHMPTIGTVRQLRQRLLIGDYWEGDYERAEDAIRPLALLLMIQAAKWATTAGSGGKLELTKRGQAMFGTALGPQHIRDLWESWAKTDLLDELSRVRAIRGQQSKGARLTKPAERREKLAATLRESEPDEWVPLDEFFRYMRAQGRNVEIERSSDTALYLGSYQEYGWLGYAGTNYWDIVVGSYLRALLFEYAATLGLIEISYTRPEDSLHSFGDAYGLDEYEYLSRYDGLLGLRLTGLGAYVFGQSDSYTAPAPATSQTPPLKVLPNLDVVVVDPAGILPYEYAFLERIAAAQSAGVYRLSRDMLMDAVAGGLELSQAIEFLVAKSGQPLEEFPQIVRVFLEDLQKRLGALRVGGRMVMVESDDAFLLTELSNSPGLRAQLRLASIDGRTVLLIPEDQETAAWRALKKLGYIPRKG